MSAYAWAVTGAAASAQILPADEYRDELVIQLHAMAVEGADPVFLGFGEDAVTEKGLFLGGIGHTVRVLGAKARLAAYALSDADASGGIETHTSIEYRHTPNYPLWQKLPEQGEGPTVVHYSPLDDSEDIIVGFGTFIIMYDMNVFANVGTIILWKFNPLGADDQIEVFDVEGASVVIDGGVVSLVSTTGDLDPDSTYYFTADATAIMSDLGDFWEGIADTTTWNFATA